MIKKIKTKPEAKKAEQNIKVDVVKNLTVEFLKKLEQKAEIAVEEDVLSNTILIKIKVDDPAFLIGFHGKTISSFQIILGLMTYKTLGEWVKVAVDVNDYRVQQAEKLKGMAITAAERAKGAGEPVVLPPMSSFERRAIHIALTDFEGVEAVSEGEGELRHIVIKPKVDSQK